MGAVNGRITLARAAEGYQIGKEIRLSVGEERTGGRRKPSLLADAMEKLRALVRGEQSHTGTSD